MKNVIAHAHRHFKGHINDHKHHYLFGIFGGFALFKLFLLLMGITVVQYTVFTNAQEDTIEDPNPIVEEDGIDGIDEIDEEEDGIDGIDEEEDGIDGIDEEEDGIDGIDEEEDGIDEEEDGIDEKEDGIDEEIVDEEIVDEEIVDEEILDTNNEWNGICESGDLTFSRPLSGSNVRNILDIVWNYTGCSVSGMLLQLWDHNQQRIDLTTLASGATSYAFDSASLYSFQQSGLYHIVGTNMSGNDYYLYTGQYTGVYSRLYTGYMLRILDADMTTITETGLFTIDNELPTLTGVTVTTNGLATGYLGKSGVVTLSFVANELLDDVVVTLGSGKAPTSSSISNLTHTYTWTLNSLYREGDIVVAVSFADLAGNTGALVYTSALVFDMTNPVVSGIVFTGSDSGLVLNFVSSEPVHFGIDYRKDATILHGVDSEYLTSHQIALPNIEVDQLYTFALEVFDHVHNSRVVTGDFMKTLSGDITSHITVVALVTQEELSGEVATLTNVLKTEVEKYSTCKEAITYTPVELEIRRSVYTLQMPDFQKSQVKVLVNAFTLFVLDKVKHNYTITKSDIDEITKKFNSFLIVLKLLRDDDNTCKQNLSNYHVGQFKNVLEEFNIELD